MHGWYVLHNQAQLYKPFFQTGRLVKTLYEQSFHEKPMTDNNQAPLYGEWFAINQSRIDNFAEVTEDRQYIHIDPERAKDTDLGGTIAHGFLSLSLLPRLFEGCKPPVDDVVMAVNYGFDKVRFLNPVRPDDQIRFCAKEVSLDAKGDQRFLQKLAVTIEIKGQQKPALACEWLNLFICKAEDRM